MQNKIDTIIFDLGGVLIDWDPKYVYREVFDGDEEKVNWFLDTVCTFPWNEQQDAGRTIEEANAERIALFPEYEKEIRVYYDRWEEMLGGVLSGTVEILKSLIQNENYKVYALTNWSAETFPKALQKFDFLHWFDGVIVSGEVKMKKPAKEIYELTLERFGITANQSIFIDDKQENIDAAVDLGIHGIRFVNPAQLKDDLEKRFGLTV